MTEPSKKIVLPAYLIRRLEAFRIAKGSEHSYVVRDKLYGKTYDFDPWQFFILEVLPGCESLEKLQAVFHDRFGRTITGRNSMRCLRRSPTRSFSTKPRCSIRCSSRSPGARSKSSTARRSTSPSAR